MSDQTTEITSVDTGMRNKTLLVGAILGAGIGALAAYLFFQNAAEEGKIEVTPGEGIKLGVLVFGLLRSIASLGD